MFYDLMTDIMHQKEFCVFVSVVMKHYKYKLNSFNA